MEEDEPMTKEEKIEKPATKKPAEKLPAGKKPTDKKPVDKKPVEKKPVDEGKGASISTPADTTAQVDTAESVVTVPQARVYYPVQRERFRLIRANR